MKLYAFTGSDIGGHANLYVRKVDSHGPLGEYLTEEELAPIARWIEDGIRRKEVRDDANPTK